MCSDLHRFLCSPWSATNNGHSYADRIGGRDAGTTVLQYYEQHYPAAGTREQWQLRIANGQVTHNNTGQPLADGTKLRVGDEITYHRLPWTEPEAPNFFDVLYEDEHVLAICKPAGLQVLPKGLFCQRTVLGLLQQYHHQKRSLKYPGSLLPAPVHRLGRGTSGVLLCACTAAARVKLTREFSTSTALAVATSATTSPAETASVQGSTSGRDLTQCLHGKIYRALASGIIQCNEGEVTVPIGPVSYPGLSTGLFAANTTGKPARSLCRVLERRQDSTIVEVTILTGRPHQIRIHMAYLGHPLVGDPLYGPGGLPKAAVVAGVTQGGADGDAEAVMPGDCGYHLHSSDLSFTHPASGQQTLVKALIPPMLCTSAELMTRQLTP